MNEADREYFAVDALSASGCKLILKSPAHYKADREIKREPTKAMVMGTIFHSLVLMPHENPEYAVQRQPWTTKEGKAEKEHLQSLGVPIISEKEESAILAMRDAIYQHRMVVEMLDEARAYTIAPESAIYWSGGIAQVAMKCKPDAVTEDAILDLKTCFDASPDGFSRQIAQFGYAIQAAMYIDGVYHETGTKKKFRFIAIEKEPPYAIGVYELDAASILTGEAKRQRAAVIYGRCRSNDTWPSYEPVIKTLSLPNWAHDEQDFDDRECDF